MKNQMTHKNYKIEMATDHDIPEITKLLNKAYKELADQGLNYTATFQNNDKTKERISRGRCLVLKNEAQQIVGTILMTVENYFTKRKTAYLGQFGVLPEYKKSGLGTFLMNYCEELAQKEGFEGVQLDTAIPATHLVNWYLRRNYKIVGQEKYEGKTYESYVFEKTFSVSFEIRKAQIKDVNNLAKVHIQSWQESYIGLLPQRYLDDLPLQTSNRIKMWTSILENPKRWAWVAVVDQQVVGFVLFGPPRDPDRNEYIELGAIYLLKKYKGQRIGLSLLQEGFKNMATLGYKKAYCWVLEGNPTIQFYTKTNAYFCHQTKVDEIGGEEFNELAYEWSSLELKPKLI